MRAFWITLLLLGAVAAAAILLSGGDEPAPSRVSAEQHPNEPSAVEPVTPLTNPVLVVPLPSTPSLQQPATPSAALAPAPDGETLPLGLDQKIQGATIRPGRIVAKGNTLLADGKFTIHGKGTKESPYEVSWDLLMSASDTFVPRLGESQIPQRVAMLNGAYVRISGFIAFPLVATEAGECLVMLNQWDGCCIGVPPSPYDAVEVKLSIPADSSRRHLVRVGSVEGVFHIDPYVVERWLVGLYTMDFATLSTEM